MEQLEKARDTIDTEQKESTIEMEELKQIREEQKEMKKKYKSFLTTYNDKNVKLFNGEELTESSDVDMSKKLINNIFLNFHRKISPFDDLFESICCLHAFKKFQLSIESSSRCF